jgi:hypothetical protein
MKSVKYISFIILSIVYFQTVNALGQKKKVETSEFKVSGVCGMCEQRIESAALIKGVKYAEWDKQNQMLKVIYKTKHVTELDIHKSVAETGHDTEEVKASDKKYKELPACCAYRDGVEVH